MTVVGLDLHKRYVTACAMDESGTVLAEQRRLAPELGVLERFLATLPPPVTIAVEATLCCAWLYEQLVERGYTVKVAHAYQVKLIGPARAKTDPIDARKLAELTRANLLPTIWVADPATRARRKLLRGRAFLVRMRTQVKNRIHGHLMAENCRTGVTDIYGVAGRAWLVSLALPPAVRQQVDVLLEIVDALGARIKRLDRAVQKQARHDPQADPAPDGARHWRVRRDADTGRSGVARALPLEPRAGGLRRAGPEYA